MGQTKSLSTHPNKSTSPRRRFLIAAAGSLATAAAIARAKGIDAPVSVTEIEAEIGGRVGVFAVDTASGKVLAHRPDERFAMCSTFKWVLVAAALDQVERQTLFLDEFLVFGQADLLTYSPVTSQHIAEGFMTVGALARATIVTSDNTAANLLLAKLGGPSAVTQFARSCGDPVTRLDRNEPTLNSNISNDLRDTTSPRAMTALMQAVLCGNRLAAASRSFLLQCLSDCETGLDRLRTNFPPTWMAGDKTGTGEHGAVNDVAIAIPPGRAPILISAFLSEGKVEHRALVRAHAHIGRLVTQHFA